LPNIFRFSAERFIIRAGQTRRRQTVKVVLLEDVRRLGMAGEVKEVADGYGRNFLLPRKLAMLATPPALKEAEILRQKQAETQQQLNTEFSELAQQIEGITVSFKAKVAAEDRLYGSVRETDIAREVSNVIGSDIDKEKVELQEPIRQLGSYEITVRLTQDLAPKITVTVEEEDSGA
jgi:large subunit ribosomal protein L9